MGQPQSKGGSQYKAAAPKKAAKTAPDPKDIKARMEFLQKTFDKTGSERSLTAGETLIEQGVTSTKMFFIKEGRVDLVLKREGQPDLDLATRSAGEELGELSLLLGHATTNAAIAGTDVTVLEVDQVKLLELLTEDEKTAGKLFKVLATILSERISELSSRMRSVVTKGLKPGKGAALPAVDTKRVRTKFGLSPEDKLMGVYRCSVKREVNAQVKDQNAHFGIVYIFESSLCFDLQMFAFKKKLVIDNADVIGLLRSDPNTGGESNTVEVQSKGQSIELHINDDFEEACLLIEACRLKAKTKQLGKSSSALGEQTTADDEGHVSLEQFNSVIEPMIHSHSDAGENKSVLEELDMHEDDWGLFLSAAATRTYAKGQYVVQEGEPSAALYQIVSGALRVELKLNEQAQAVVVGFRGAGEMLGETSMLKEGLATASVAADQITTVVEMKASALDALFKEHPRLPARFFCFLATYQGERLYKLTQAFADSQTPQVTIAASLAIPIEEVVHIPAFCGKLRTYLLKAEETASTKDEQARALGLLTLFEFYVDVQDEYAELPDKAALTEEAPNLQAKYLVEGPKTSLVIPGAEFICKETCAEVDSAISSLKSGGLSTRKARQIFAGAQTEALAALNAGCYDAFMGSKHYRYILELKAKEKIVPALEDFKVVRVLGEGGFGQVIEVIKRDCGVHYALKVMRKEMLKECLGSSWRKKIALEQSILATLQHPFLVNLKYAFQNPEFLLLVMDLVPQGDLSEFVLTKRRLTPPQVKWAIMETVEVMGYIHGQSIIYRDLKPENLLVDEQGHVRLIDMGLAARVTEAAPKRRSRVGTDCYMAPEVRWAARRRKPYGKSADWYTIGVLTYEFTQGDLPFSALDSPAPVYRGGKFPSPACKDFCEALLVQDEDKRLGSSEDGLADVKGHPYFEGIDWDIISACKLLSPMKGVKSVPKRKKDKELAAQRTAQDIKAVDDQPELDPDAGSLRVIDTWDFVAPTAVTEEHMDSVYHAVSVI